MIATVHAQSEAQDSSLPCLPVYDNVVARRSCGAQLDSKCSAGVRMDTAQPHSLTTKVNLVHVEECAPLNPLQRASRYSSAVRTSMSMQGMP
jgi:hypothetical protein